MECRRRGGKPFFWCVGRKNRLGRRLMLRACLLRLRRRPRDVLPRGLHLSHRTLTPGVASSGCQNGAPVVLVDASFVVDTTRAWRHAAIEHIEPHLGCRCQRKGSPSSGTSIPENRGRTRWARTRKAHGELAAFIYYLNYLLFCRHRVPCSPDLRRASVACSFCAVRLLSFDHV